MNTKSIEGKLLTSCQKQQSESCSGIEQTNILTEHNAGLKIDKSQYASDLLISSVIIFIIFLLVIRTNARHS